jgi:hypothetical protein
MSTLHRFLRKYLPNGTQGRPSFSIRSAPLATRLTWWCSIVSTADPAGLYKHRNPSRAVYAIFGVHAQDRKRDLKYAPDKALRYVD